MTMPRKFNVKGATLALTVVGSQRLISAQTDSGGWVLVAEHIKGCWYFRKHNPVTNAYDYEPYLSDDQRILDAVAPSTGKDGR